MSDSMAPWLEAARSLHARAIVVDSHCDTTQRLLISEWDFSKLHDDGHVDIPRLRSGGFGAVALAVYAPGPMAAGKGPKAARSQLDAVDATIQRHTAQLVAARTAEDVRRAKQEGRIAVLVGIEGGYLIDDSLDVLREFHNRGAIYLTLTHGFHTSWADSSGVHEDLAPLHGGLTKFGEEVVSEMNRLGMMVDVSHVSEDTFWRVIDVSYYSPIIASHSSCRALSPHRRNLTDEMMRWVKKRGGVVQINFASAFIDPAFPAIDPKVVEYWSTRVGFAASPYAQHETPLSVLADHFDHAIELVGPDHVGIGSDFDGVGALPRGMEDCSKLPYLTAELLRRGHSEADLIKVLGGNFLRVMEVCQSMAQKPPTRWVQFISRLWRSAGMRAERPQSDLILASASPRRAQILRDMGFDFEVSPSPDEEAPAPSDHENPAQWAEQISLTKAQSVARRRKSGLILAGDTIAVLDRRIIGKPKDRAHAEAILRALSGTTHQVISALTLLDAVTGRSLVRHDITNVHMKALSDPEILDYLDSGQWQGKAGAYGIQDHGDKFVERIEGSFTNVVGLPVELLERMLSEWSMNQETTLPARSHD